MSICSLYIYKIIIHYIFRCVCLHYTIYIFPVDLSYNPNKQRGKALKIMRIPFYVTGPKIFSLEASLLLVGWGGRWLSLVTLKTDTKMYQCNHVKIIWQSLAFSLCCMFLKAHTTHPPLPGCLAQSKGSKKYLMNEQMILLWAEEWSCKIP